MTQESNLTPWDFTRQPLRDAMVFKPFASRTPARHQKLIYFPTTKQGELLPLSCLR